MEHHRLADNSSQKKKTSKWIRVLLHTEGLNYLKTALLKQKLYG